MIIYKVEYNSECNCHPFYQTWGYYLTKELAKKGLDELMANRDRYGEIEEVEVVTE